MKEPTIIELGNIGEALKYVNQYLELDPTDERVQQNKRNYERIIREVNKVLSRHGET